MSSVCLWHRKPGETEQNQRCRSCCPAEIGGSQHGNRSTEHIYRSKHSSILLPSFTRFLVSSFQFLSSVTPYLSSLWMVAAILQSSIFLFTVQIGFSSKFSDISIELNRTALGTCGCACVFCVLIYVKSNVAALKIRVMCYAMRCVCIV